MSNIVMKQLRCSLCRDYLSSSPIRLLSDGSSICGRCTPPNTDAPIYRQLVLESVVSKLSFPCRFTERGCKELILFGQKNEHESKCAYQPSTCSAVVPIPCVWNGPLENIHEHFSTEHPNLIKDEVIFKIEVDQDAREVFLVKKDDLVFVVHYAYDLSRKILKYCVKYYVLSNAKYNVSGKLQMNNVAEPDYTVGQKSFACGLYDDGFDTIEDPMYLKIGNLLPALDDASCVEIKIKLTCIELNKNETRKRCLGTLGPDELFDLYQQHLFHEQVRRNIKVEGQPKKIKLIVID